jgi:hypothetical protein
MGRGRDYKAEYERRIARGLARGLTRAHARGHAKPKKRKKKPERVKPDRNIDDAMREINRGRSLTAAAKLYDVPVQRLRRYLVENKLAVRRGRRRVPADKRLRKIRIVTGGRVRVVMVSGFKAAQLAGAHHHAVYAFVRNNDLGLLKQFVGRSIRAADGRKYVLETDPNALHRIAPVDTPSFHEIYEITSNT